MEKEADPARGSSGGLQQAKLMPLQDTQVFCAVLTMGPQWELDSGLQEGRGAQPETCHEVSAAARPCPFVRTC